MGAYKKLVAAVAAIVSAAADESKQNKTESETYP